jgi:hypothetical protein
MATLLGWLALHQHLTVMQMAGVGLVVTAVALPQRHSAPIDAPAPTAPPFLPLVRNTDQHRRSAMHLNSLTIPSHALRPRPGGLFLQLLAADVKVREAA